MVTETNPTPPEGATLETLSKTATEAFDAYAAGPTDETKATYEEAFGRVSGYKPPEPKLPEPPKPPDKYELNVSEDSLLDPSRVDEISTYAKEKGLSNEAAQELVTREETAVTEYHKEQLQVVEDAKAKWAEDTKADKEIGGADFQKNEELAVRVVERFGTKALGEALNKSGFGVHTEMVRMLVRIGKAMADDEAINPKGTPPAGERTHEQVLYGSGSKT